MFDRYYCIKTNCDTWKSENFEENEPVNLYFLRLKARGNGTFTACVLKTPIPGQIPTSCWRHGFTFAVVHATDADVTSYDGPGMHIVKAAKQVYNSTWIALLKHGFVLVKTWLLIACGTGFYAIIYVLYSNQEMSLKIDRMKDRFSFVFSHLSFNSTKLVHCIQPLLLYLIYSSVC